MQATVARTSASRAVRPSTATVRPQASLKVSQAAKAAGVAISSLALAFAANADVTVKLGADSGALVFEPSAVTIKAGESVTWVNNAGFPHNIVFDEDDIPSGANAEALSHEDYLNAPGQTVSSKFDAAGTYGYYCEPHQGAGMKGKVIVQ